MDILNSAKIRTAKILYNSITAKYKCNFYLRKSSNTTIDAENIAPYFRYQNPLLDEKADILLIYSFFY
jgi:hypothetical protein